jgi:hypothetical protein
MSDEQPKRKGRIWYTIWPGDGEPKSFGPQEMKTTFHPHPKESNEDGDTEGEKRSA